MVERRADVRTRTQLCVDVSGNDLHCGGFHASVLATSLSLSGALITKVHAELRCGDLLALEYGGRHAYFRIEWVREGGENEGMQVGIHRPNGQACPWENMLAAEPLLSVSSER